MKFHFRSFPLVDNHSPWPAKTPPCSPSYQPTINMHPPAKCWATQARISEAALLLSDGEDVLGDRAVQPESGVPDQEADRTQAEC